MVNSISYALGKQKLVTGFGARRCRPSAGRGIVRSALGAVSRPALTFIANKIADAISGSGSRRKRRRTVRGSSYKITGTGASRRPRSTLTRRRTTNTTTRRPRSPLSGTGRRRKHRTTRR